MDFEAIWYESAPFIYAIAGIASLMSDSRLAVVSGVLLLTASSTILRLRWVYRKKRKTE